ncbi:MAG: hypothetical protein U5Q44_06540 [Dehalococcoidia bacterium]|nr:hypothetical protein [Dehalococcoidia bacterium]
MAADLHLLPSSIIAIIFMTSLLDTVQPKVTPVVKPDLVGEVQVNPGADLIEGVRLRD